MFSMQRKRNRMPGILILGICLLLFSSTPPQITQAVQIPKEINNTIADFKEGRFQRAALANVLRSNPGAQLTDKLGGVQLGPVGLIKGWKPGLFRLPLDEALYSMGAAAIGSRIFIVGGRTTRGVAGSRPLAEVWSVGVSTLDGALLDPGWQQETSLPAAQGSDQTIPFEGMTTPVAKVESPAVTAISTDASGLNGFIYVIGGNVPYLDQDNATFTFTSYAVRIGTVTNGHITGWLDQVGAHIPSLDPSNPFILSHGVQQAQAVTAQVGGKIYVYLIGGLQWITDINGNTTSSGLKTVFYAQVGAGGKLFKPSSPGTEGWDRTMDLPVANQASVAGLWDASAVSDNFVASTQTSANAIYVIGGQVTPSPQESGHPEIPASYSEKVYRALINTSNGSLDWTGWEGLLPEPRSQSTAIPFRGNIYMAGGAVNGGDAESFVLTSYVEDDLRLHQFTSPPPGIGGAGTHFLKSNPDDNVLTKPRKLHGSVLVRADANSPNSAFLFVLGGIGTQEDSNGANTILYGKIGGGEDVSTTGYAGDGWYYAQPFNVAQQFAHVQVQEIDWTTLITSTDMDIALDYRLSDASNLPDCSDAVWQGWLPLDGAAGVGAPFSVNGENLTTIADVSARCFQYRARLSTTINPLTTPILLNVSVKVNVPGSPDLKLTSFAPQRGLNDVLVGLSVVIQNNNLIDPPTLAADAEKKGDFFVDLCIFAPGVAVVPPTLPFVNAPGGYQCSTVYAKINRSLLSADGPPFTIPQWLDTVTSQKATLTNYFKTPGMYTVIVAIDSLDNVDEGDPTSPKETNNVSQAFTFPVAKANPQISLPLVRKS